MERKDWSIIGLMAMFILFCHSVYAQEVDFVQPCPDAGGYYGWLRGPNENHLGHDYNAPAGTKVKAISDGIVWETYTNISGFGSEGKPGPAIWIKHRLTNGKYFYALYGHVEPNQEVRNGYQVRRGQIVGALIRYLDKKTKEDLSHLHFGIWNSESEPPLSKMGYGSIRHFTNPIEFLENNKPYTKPRSETPFQDVSVVVKWAHEEIWKPSVFSEPSYRFAIYSGGTDGLIEYGPKVSKDGILYIDVAGPKGTELYAIDIVSGKILKSKELESGCKLWGISQRAVYLVVPGRSSMELKSLFALDRVHWNLLWEKGRIDTKQFSKMLLIEKGILYRRSFLAGKKIVPVQVGDKVFGHSTVRQYKTEIGLLNEVTGMPEPLWEPIDIDRVRTTQSSGIVSPSHFKALLVAHHVSEYVSERGGQIKSSYASSVFDLASGQILSKKEWSSMPRVLGQSEANGKFFIMTEGSRIVSVDMNTGKIEWETDDLPMGPHGPFRIGGATKKVLLVHGYGIDTANGKILWKEWGKIDYRKDTDPTFLMLGWRKIVGDMVLVGKPRSNQLLLINPLTLEIIVQQENFPATREGWRAVYKNILLVGTPNGLRAYQIKK